MWIGEQKIHRTVRHGKYRENVQPAFVYKKNERQKMNMMIDIKHISNFPDTFYTVHINFLIIWNDNLALLENNNIDTPILLIGLVFNKVRPINQPNHTLKYFDSV